MFGEGVPEGRGSYGKGSSPQVWCLVLSHGDRMLASEEWRLMERSVVVEQVGEIGGGPGYGGLCE